MELGGGKEKSQAIRDIISTVLDNKELVNQKTERAYIHFLTHLSQAYEKLEVRTYEGTIDLFERLRSYNIYIVLNTGYNRKTAINLLNKLNWSEGVEYDLLVTADDVSQGRPAPDMIQLAMDKMGISNAKEVVKVGDSAVDILEGKAAGCGWTFGVTTGAQTEAQLLSANPDGIIHGLWELTEKLPFSNIKLEN